MDVRFAEEHAAIRQVADCSHSVSRGDDDLHRWPPISNRCWQFQAVHAAGHVDVREDEPDFARGM